jgi:GT2 family glycosyltransferase
MEIYTVIPNYILSEEIATLAKNAIASFQKDGCKVIAVDDGSPCSVECLSGADYVVTRENGGFAKAMNSGLRKAMELAKEDDWIVVANNDLETRGNWIEEAERCFNDFQADLVGGLGCRDYTAENPFKNDLRVSEGGLFMDWLFPGGFFIVKKKFFEDCGLYDEAYEHGGVEDIDLFYVAKKQGKRLIMTPKIWYWHKEGATRYSDTQRDTQRDAIKRNEQYFKDKYGLDPIRNLNKILTCTYLNP